MGESTPYDVTGATACGAAKTAAIGRRAKVEKRILVKSLCTTDDARSEVLVG